MRRTVTLEKPPGVGISATLALVWLCGLLYSFTSVVVPWREIRTLVAQSIQGPYFPGEFLITWARNGWGFLIAIFVLLGGVGWGRHVESVARRSLPLSVRIALGMLLVGLGVLAFGLLGLLDRPCLVLIMLPAASAARNIRKYAIETGILSLREDIASGACGVAIIVLCCMYGVFALAPERGWDALTYHLRVPHLWLADGRIHPVPSVPMSLYPFLGEMWFTAAMAFAGDQGAKLLNVLMLPLIGMTLLPMGKSAGKFQGGWLAALLFVAMPSAGMVGGQAYVDLEAAWLSVAAVRMAARGGPSHALIVGLLCAAALSTKYSGMWVALICVGILSLRGERLRALRDAAVVAGATLTLFSAWPVRNWLWTGNPVYPLVPGMASGGGWNPYLTAQQAYSILPVSPPHEVISTLAALIRFPLDLSWGAKALGVVNGPLIPGLLPALFLAGTIRDPATAKLALGGGVYSGLWILTQSNDSRFLLPGIAMLAIPAAEGARRLCRGRLLTAMTVLAIFAGITVQALHWVESVSRAYSPWRVAFGLEPPSLYVSRAELPAHEMTLMAAKAAKVVPRGSRILCLADIQAYQFNREVIVDLQ